MTDRKNITITIKHKVVYGLSIAVFTFDLDPLWRSTSNYRPIWIANISKMERASAKMHNHNICRYRFSLSNATIVDILARNLNLDSGHLFTSCEYRPTLNVNISKPVTDRANVTIAMKYKVVYGLSIAISTFTLTHSKDQCQSLAHFSKSKQI